MHRENFPFFCNDIIYLDNLRESITITEDDKYGVVDCNNQKVLENKYQDIKSLTENGIYAVKENNNWELVQRNGELKLSEGLQNVQDILGIKNGNIIIKNQ